MTVLAELRVVQRRKRPLCTEPTAVDELRSVNGTNFRALILKPCDGRCFFGLLAKVKVAEMMGESSGGRRSEVEELEVAADNANVSTPRQN